MSALFEIFLSFLATSKTPENLSKMGRNIGLGAFGVGLFQILKRCLVIAHTKLHPSHTIENERVLRRERQRSRNEFERLWQTLIAIR